VKNGGNSDEDTTEETVEPDGEAPSQTEGTQLLSEIQQLPLASGVHGAEKK